MNPSARLILALFLLFKVQATFAEDNPLVVVTEAYPPFVFMQNDLVLGSDWEIVRAVLGEMDIAAELQFCPWKRCLLKVRTGEADAILDVSRTPEREKEIVFPEEHLSSAPTVFFKRVEEDVPYSTLEDLSHLTVGAGLGYDYCDELDDPPFRVERAKSLEINLSKLVRKRVDLVLAVYPVATFTAQEMRLAHRVDMVPGAVFCNDSDNYLAFSKNSAQRLDVLAFSKRLRHFKRTEEYRQILTRYGVNANGLVQTHKASQPQ